MSEPPEGQCSSLAPKLTAPQQKPRPLPLFLALLRSETAGDPDRMARALAGLRRYQEAERAPPLPPMPAIAEAHGAVLRDYGGDGPDLLFVPSLINPPNVLDLSIERSMLRWMSGQGHRVLLLDWGRDIGPRAGLTIAGHVEAIIVPFVRRLADPPAVVGYCLGGTMSVAAACLEPVRALATLAAPWDFSGFSAEVRAMLGRLWENAEPSARTLNALPMEVLQAVFWSLDPSRTIRKFEDLVDLAGGSAEHRAFVTLEDWANDGPPLPAGAAEEFFERMIAANDTGGGRWTVGGTTVNPAGLRCPQLHVASTTDRIVPEASSLTTGEQWRVDQGHVGMVVGSRAKEALWEPLSSWLSQCSKGC